MREFSDIPVHSHSRPRRRQKPILEPLTILHLHGLPADSTGRLQVFSLFTGIMGRDKKDRGAGRTSEGSGSCDGTALAATTLTQTYASQQCGLCKQDVETEAEEHIAGVARGLLLSSWRRLLQVPDGFVVQTANCLQF